MPSASQFRFGVFLRPQINKLCSGAAVMPDGEADIRIEKRHAVLLKHLISEMLYRSPMQNIVTVRDRSQARTKAQEHVTPNEWRKRLN